MDLKIAAAYVIGALDKAYPHARAIRTLWQHYGGPTWTLVDGNTVEVEKSWIIGQVIEGLGDGVVIEHRDYPGVDEVVKLSEPLNRAGGSSHLAGLMFRGVLVKSPYTPPEYTATPFDEALKLLNETRLKALKVLDVIGVSEDDATTPRKPADEAADAVSAVQYHLAILRGEQPMGYDIAQLGDYLAYVVVDTLPAHSLRAAARMLQQCARELVAKAKEAEADEDE